MPDYVPAVQERLRKMGFPRFGQHETRELILGPKPEMWSSQRWTFTTKDEREGVILANSFLVLQTTKYDVFEDFVTRLESAAAVVRDECDVDLIERIGLRYIDVIGPSQDAPSAQFLSVGLRGLSHEDLEAKSVRLRSEQVAETAIGRLVVRVIQTTDGTFLPPDLDPLSLRFGVQFPSDQKLSILDIDHYSEAGRDFESEALTESMWKLHDHCDKAFRRAVTPEALEHWGATQR